MERCQRTATTSTRRMCSSQLTWELASIACPSPGPVLSLRVSELSVLRWVSKRFSAGTAKPVGGNVFVEICNHSYIYSHFHSCVGKEKMILFTSNNCVPLSTLTVEGSFRRSQKFNKAIQSFPISILLFIFLNDVPFKRNQDPRYRIPRLKSTYFISGGCLLPRLF